MAYVSIKNRRKRRERKAFALAVLTTVAFIGAVSFLHYNQEYIFTTSVIVASLFAVMILYSLFMDRMDRMD